MKKKRAELQMTKKATTWEAAATSARPEEGGKRPAEKKQPRIQAGKQMPDSQHRQWPAGRSNCVPQERAPGYRDGPPSVAQP